MKTAITFVQPMDFTGIPNTTSWAGYDFLQWTGDTYHPGLDYNYGAGEQDKGKPVRCIGNGVVEKIIYWDGKTKGFGNHLFILHELEDGTVIYSHYCHLDTITCKEGDEVDKGQEIGTCGGSGGWPSHLHMEIRYPIGKGYTFWPKGYSKDWVAARYIDPYGFIEKRKETSSDASNTYEKAYEDYVAVSGEIGEGMNKDLQIAQIQKWKSMEEALRKKEVEIEQKDKQIEEVREQAATLSEEIERLQRENEDLRNESEATQKKVSEQATSIKRLSDRIKELEEVTPTTEQSTTYYFKHFIKSLFGW